MVYLNVQARSQLIMVAFLNIKIFLNLSFKLFNEVQNIQSSKCFLKKKNETSRILQIKISKGEWQEIEKMISINGNFLMSMIR